MQTHIETMLYPAVKSLFIIIFVIVLLVNSREVGADEAPLAQAADVQSVPSINGKDFYEKFSNNKSLKKEDLHIFPVELQTYLFYGRDWSYRQVSGFSRLIGQRTFLFAVEMDSIGSPSRAVIVYSGKRQEISPKAFLTWERLYLPGLTRRENGTEVVASDRHSGLRWNDEIDAVQTNHCSDAPPHFCSRNTYWIYPSRSELLKIELLRGRKYDWQTIWENGQWFVDHKLEPLQ